MGRASELWALAALFSRLGVTAFGGPAAHVAMMEDEVVRRRRWMTDEELLDLVGATNLIPGPNSTELAIHIGHRRAGFPGLVVAGVAFILPAALITAAIAWAYVRFGSLPEATWVLYGIKPVIIAVVVQALVALGKKAMKTKLLAALAIGAAIASFAGGHELVLLLLAGVIAAIARAPKGAPLPAIFPFFGAGALAAAPVPFGLGALFLFFLKIGSVLFGSGYVLLAFLRADLVERWHWMTEAQLLDAIAVGQITPGPVFTAATFVGYVLGGGAGALLATLGIFLPAFVLVALSGPLIPRIRQSPVAGAFLDGVNAASLALMAVVTWQLTRAAVVDAPTLVLAAASAIVLIKWKPNTMWLVLGGAILGVAIRAMRP